MRSFPYRGQLSRIASRLPARHQCFDQIIAICFVHLIHTQCRVTNDQFTDQVKADGGALIGRHADSIVGLGFQGISVFSGRRKTPAVNSGNDPGATTKPIDHKLRGESPVIEETKTDGMCMATKASGQEHNAFLLGQGHGQKTASGGLGKVDTEVDKKEDRQEDQEKMEEKVNDEIKEEEEEVGFGLVVLSASMDGVIRAWEMLGKSEKYRMRHRSGVEVTSMLVLPGGAVLVTGEILVLLRKHLFISVISCASSKVQLSHSPESVFAAYQSRNIQHWLHTRVFLDTL